MTDPDVPTPSVLRYWRFIWQSALAELRHRYAGTGLGLFWNVLHPIALIAVFSFVFGVILQQNARPDNAIPGVAGRFQFVLYLCAGLLPWLAFSECVTRGCNAFAENAAYLKKLPIPEQVFVAQTAASATLGLLISFGLLVLASLLLGLRPTWHWLLLPIPLIAVQSIGFGLGLLCGTLNVFFRDIGQLVGVVLQLVMWTVPVVYVLPDFSPALTALSRLHPLLPPLEGIRDLFLFGRLPELWAWAGMIAWPAAVLAVAWVAFSKLRREIRDLL